MIIIHTNDFIFNITSDKINVVMKMILKSFLGLIKSMLLFLIYVIITSVLPTSLGKELISLLAAVIFIIIISLSFNRELKEDLKELKNKFKFKYLLLGIVMSFIVIGVDYLLVKNLGHNSANQTSVVDMLKTSPIIMILGTVVFIPFAEELIYRFPYRKSNKVLSFIISSLVFAAIHMVGTKEIIFIVPYLLLSFTISFTYFKTDNIYMSYLVHVINNLINVLLLIW